jgi:hypothetical protein
MSKRNYQKFALDFATSVMDTLSDSNIIQYKSFESQLKVDAVGCPVADIAGHCLPMVT